MSGCGGDATTTPRRAPAPASPARSALAKELRGITGAGVVVDVRTGRILAAAGSGGRSPWSSLGPAEAAIDPVLAGAALDAGLATTAELRRALSSTRADAFADVVVRLTGYSADEVLRRVGFDRRARAGDLRDRVAISPGPSLTPEGAHGVGSVPNFAPGTRDPAARARTTAFELAQVALTLASDGRRTDLGRTRPGPDPLQPPWAPATGRRLRKLTGGLVTGRGSVIAFTRKRAIALTARGTADLARKARRLARES